MQDFENTLLEIGIKPIRILPVYNKTKKVFYDSKLSELTYNNIFGPYIKYNKLPYKYDVSKISKARVAIFPIFSRVRALKIHRYDIRQMNNTIYFLRSKK